MTKWFDYLPKWLRKALAAAAPTCTLWNYDFARMAYSFVLWPTICVTATQFRDAKHSGVVEIQWMGTLVVSNNPRIEMIYEL